MAERHDAIVVGAGPNGLAAAIELAGAGRSVLVVEAHDEVGGGMRSAELTLPGFVHDVCSAVHSLAVASPFLKELPLDRYGLELVHPDAPFAHPLDDGSAAIVERSVEATADGLGGRDAAAWRSTLGPLVEHADELATDMMAPPLRVPRHPLVYGRFGVLALRSARAIASRFRGERARALFAGAAAHAMLPLEKAPSGAFGLALTVFAHAAGWPVARGGSVRLADAMASHLRSLGGEIECGRTVQSMDDLPRARAYLFATTPRALAWIARDRLPASYVGKLRRFRYGPGVFKVDWALDGPVPWKAAECLRAGTVHLGGTFEEIAGAEADVAAGRHPERPYMITVQPTTFDDSRAPAGKHTLWAYCHVPNGSTLDMTDAMEQQVERFAPGFRDLVLAKCVRGPAELEAYDANYVGGDINAGIQDLRQHFGRPVISPNPYATPNRAIYLCSSSTPPGGGVHGMCGYWAARAAVRRAF